MGIETRVENAAGDLTPFIHSINSAFDLAIPRITSKIPVDDIVATFRVDPERAIRHLGFGGFAWTDREIVIPINPTFPNLDQSLKNNLGKTLAHELYHVLQGYTFDRGGNNLLESLIHEGLADHFDLEVFEGAPEKWDIALTPQQLIDYRKKAERDFDNRQYDHQAWFFGDHDIPHWTGYSLGFDIVGKYFERNPDKKPSTVWQLPAKEFLK